MSSKGYSHLETPGMQAHAVSQEGLPDSCPTDILVQIDTVKLEDYYPRLSSDIKVLVIHGKLDGIVPFSYSNDILRHIPWAKRIEVGMQPGQVEHLDFGHNWFEYFDSNVWCEVIERFIG